MIEITPFIEKYGEQVNKLIVNIQQNEFGIPITIEDQPDLLDIPNFYQQGNGNFWVAVTNNNVIGTISLLDINNQQVALRKMFVHKDFRGVHYGTAKRLLEKSFKWSRRQGITGIYLGTTDKFLAAHRFYEKNGFCEIDKSLLPERFPIMAVDSKFYYYSMAPANQDDGQL